MTGKTRIATTFASALAGVLLMSGFVFGAEIHVASSGGFAAAYRALAPEFERSTGHTLVTAWGPSTGTTPEAIPARLRRGEAADVVILAAGALDNLIQQGRVAAGSRVDLAQSGIGVAVRAGAAKPDIGSEAAFKRTLLAANSVAVSDSVSGVYLTTVVFLRLGIEDRMKGKTRIVSGEPVGAVVARGEAEIGFQQISELLPIAGIQYVGALPPELQRMTVFSAGIATAARQPEAGRSLIRFLASPAAAPAIAKAGMEPMGSK